MSGYQKAGIVEIVNGCRITILDTDALKRKWVDASVCTILFVSDCRDDKFEKNTSKLRHLAYQLVAILWHSRKRQGKHP